MSGVHVLIFAESSLMIDSVEAAEACRLTGSAHVEYR